MTQRSHTHWDDFGEEHDDYRDDYADVYSNHKHLVDDDTDDFGEYDDPHDVDVLDETAGQEDEVPGAVFLFIILGVWIVTMLLILGAVCYGLWMLFS